MRELAGKTAFVTGGASGIGLALGTAFAQAGMKVMLADIEAGALAEAVKSLHDFAPNVRGVACDVADPISVERTAKASYQAFGNVHVVRNNAGVAAAGGIDNISLDNWRWVLDVNLMGVLHGIRSFLPHIRAHVGGAGDAAQAVRHRRDRALSGLCSHPDWRERPQSAGALRSDADAGSRKPGGLAARPACRTPEIRARPIGCRGARSHRDPRGGTLRVHASGNARRGGRPVRRHHGGDGQSGGALVSASHSRQCKSQAATRLT